MAKKSAATPDKAPMGALSGVAADFLATISNFKYDCEGKKIKDNDNMIFKNRVFKFYN